uniref:G-protein coupled receptors family 1 profile domain-containing protein n=1 Tax=Globodera rostochiensis TaxID=31243 RepID=A0A914HYP9_GLORO
MTAQEIGTPNCTYRHDIGDDLIRSLSLWLDGPITIIAAILAFVGCYFAVCFLARAGLNRELTAALYTLCVCDAFLISTMVVYQSIEATSILFVDSNVMWDKQRSVLITHGIVSSATTASTLLVVFITFQRFLVVRWPLRFARMCASKRPTTSLHDAFLRKSSSSGCVEETELSGMFRSGGGLVRTLSKRLLRGSSNSNNRKPPDVFKLLRPFTFPVCVVVFAFLLNFSVFFEFELIPCFAFTQNAFSQQLFPTPLRRSQTYYMIRTAIAMGSQTIGPILIITLLTIVTEYKVHRSLKARRVLFESQSRRRSVVALEELREKVSRTVAIFIAVKFLIFRSLPFFFDIYESFYGIESFGIVLSILVRLSDFGVMLNSATNSLAYFGKTEFFANRLRGKLLREKQHIMVAKVAASACLVACPSPAIERSSSKSSRGTMHSMPFSDIARRRQRKAIVHSADSNQFPQPAEWDEVIRMDEGGGGGWRDEHSTQRTRTELTVHRARRGMDRGKQTNGTSKEPSKRGEENGTEVSGTEAEYAQYKSIGQQNNTTNATTTAQFESLLAVQRCQQAAPTTTCGDVIINGN